MLNYRTLCTTRESAIDYWNAKITHQDIRDGYNGQYYVFEIFWSRSLSFQALKSSASYDNVELSEFLGSGKVQKLQIYEIEYTGK